MLHCGAVRLGELRLLQVSGVKPFVARNRIDSSSQFLENFGDLSAQGLDYIPRSLS